MNDLLDFLGDPQTWWGPRGLMVRSGNHLLISVTAALVSVAIALPFAVYLGHRRVGSFAVSSLANVGRAVPTLAVVALAFPFSIRWGLGIGFWPTLVALILLGLPPIVLNTHTGIVGVDRRAVEAARGVGMRSREVITGVEIPAALPLIIAGIRIAATQIVATAALGALAGHNNLGVFVTSGIASRNTPAIVVGAVSIAGLSILTEFALTRVERRLSPWRRTPDEPAEPELMGLVPETDPVPCGGDASILNLVPSPDQPRSGC
ncbi:MAG: ABC transporter permease [Acidimicrobiales bacterium]